MDTTVTVQPVTEPAELHCHYPGELRRQPCHLSLDLYRGALTCGYSGSIGNAVPADVHNGIELRAEIPCLTGDAANVLLDEVKELAQQVLDGARVEWTGSRHEGHLNPASQDAWAAIVERCSADRFDNGDLIAKYPASEWLAESSAQELGIAAVTSDDRLKTIAGEQADEARHAGDYGYTVLDFDDVLHYLTELREQLREDLRGQLAQASIEYERALANRNRLIVQVGAFDSSRDVGDLARMSHVTALRITAGRRVD